MAGVNLLLVHPMSPVAVMYQLILILQHHEFPTTLLKRPAVILHHLEVVQQQSSTVLRILVYRTSPN